ncbi:MAG TPA: thioredoxin domain-containing protein [Solirubrobacteraceae bacterium]|jgi:protein-disulfide isomerase
MSDLRSSTVPPLGEHDHLRGDAHAPLVIFYGDFSCPFCAVAHSQLKTLRLRLAFRHFALASRPRALALACAVEAAGRQEAFWELHDALLEDQAHTEDPHLWAHATRLGLDLERFQEDRRSEEVLGRVRADLPGALRAAVAQTPTLFVDGVAHPGPPSPGLLETLSQRAVR